VDRVRQVACEFKLRNTSVVTAVGGAIVMGRMGNNELPYTSHLSWGATSACVDVATHSIGKPGDVFKGVWMPVPRSTSGSGAPTSDWEFQLPASTQTSEDTDLFFWVQTPAAGQTFELEVVTHYEAIVVPGQEQVYLPTVCIADPTMAASLTAQALSKTPLSTQVRSVETDDGDIASVVKDAAAVYSAGKVVVSGVKRAWSWIKGLFAIHTSDERALQILLDQGMTLVRLDRVLKLGNSLAADEKEEPEKAVLAKLQVTLLEMQRRAALQRFLGCDAKFISDLTVNGRRELEYQVIEPDSPVKGQPMLRLGQRLSNAAALSK